MYAIYNGCHHWHQCLCCSSLKPHGKRAIWKIHLHLQLVPSNARWSSKKSMPNLSWVQLLNSKVDFKVLGSPCLLNDNNWSVSTCSSEFLLNFVKFIVQDRTSRVCTVLNTATPVMNNPQIYITPGLGAKNYWMNCFVLMRDHPVNKCLLLSGTLRLSQGLTALFEQDIWALWQGLLSLP